MVNRTLQTVNNRLREVMMYFFTMLTPFSVVINMLKRNIQRSGFDHDEKICSLELEKGNLTEKVRELHNKVKKSQMENRVLCRDLIKKSSVIKTLQFKLGISKHQFGMLINILAMNTTNIHRFAIPQFLSKQEFIVRNHQKKNDIHSEVLFSNFPSACIVRQYFRQHKKGNGNANGIKTSDINTGSTEEKSLINAFNKIQSKLVEDKTIQRKHVATIVSTNQHQRLKGLFFIEPKVDLPDRSELVEISKGVPKYISARKS